MRITITTPDDASLDRAAQVVGAQELAYRMLRVARKLTCDNATQDDFDSIGDAIRARRIECRMTID